MFSRASFFCLLAPLLECRSSDVPHEMLFIDFFFMVMDFSPLSP